jgi:hypothetical protein
MSFIPRFTYWFGVSDKTAREWLKEWSEEDFINPIKAGAGKRVRSYILAEKLSSYNK